MADDVQNKSPQEQSADEFFKSEDPVPNETKDLGDMVKDQLKSSAQYAGKELVYSFLLSLLPMTEWRKRELTRRLASGEKMSLTEILFGRITIGRIIGWLIGGAILIFIVIQVVNSGALKMLR